MGDEDILISVVMPTYNDEEYLGEAIDSILNQTYPHFEFIIVDDGSTDATERLITSYADRRICYFKLPENKGNAYARNIGLANAKGKYIAHMDSDDICVANRLQLQLNYLEAHPEIDILGGAMCIFEKSGKAKEVYRPVDNSYTSAFFFFKNMLWQPTVMLRRDKVMSTGITYNPERENMEDYDFWFKAVWQGFKAKSLDNILLHHRVSDSQMSHPSRLDKRNAMLFEFFKERLSLMGLVLNEPDIILLHSFIRGRIKIQASTQYNSIRLSLIKLEQRNRELNKFDARAFKAALFFFRLRLIKYYFLENGKQQPFAYQFIALLFKTGPTAVLLFWANEKRNIIASD